MKWLLLLAVVSQAHSADVCEPRNFEGTYGFQLSGDTTISGTSKPVASIGRLVFDGSGKLSGYSSVNFTGLLLGNPVNGNYQVKTDCSFTWSLQDDSGALQHFAGTITPDLLRVQYRQIDPGGASHGVMVRTPALCGLAVLQPRYTFSIAGGTTPMLPGQKPHATSVSGAIAIGGGGKLQIASDGRSAPADGTVTVDSDCIAHLHMALTEGDFNFRGVVLDEGREILAIQTDPGATVTARFAAR
jgi:hypothetical protein